jgi:hypothetical protein
VVQPRLENLGGEVNGFDRNGGHALTHKAWMEELQVERCRHFRSEDDWPATVYHAWFWAPWISFSRLDSGSEHSAATKK